MRSNLLACAHACGVFPWRGEFPFSNAVWKIVCNDAAVDVGSRFARQYCGRHALASARLTVNDREWIWETKRVYLPFELERIRADIATAMLADAPERGWRHTGALLNTRPNKVLQELAEATTTAIASQSWDCVGTACALWVVMRGAYELLCLTTMLRSAVVEALQYVPFLIPFVEAIVFSCCSPTVDELAAAAMVWQPECPWCLGAISESNMRFLSCCVVSDCGPFHMVCESCVQIALDFGVKGTSACAVCHTGKGVCVLTLQAMLAALQKQAGKTFCASDAACRHDVIFNTLRTVLPQCLRASVDIAPGCPNDQHVT
jgi:hypothetical protein